MNKLFFSLALIVSVTSLFFYRSTENRSLNSLSDQTTTVNNDSFMIGVMDNGIAGTYDYLRDSLSTNIWHTYAPWHDNDGVFTNYSVYGNAVKNRLEENSNNNLQTLFDRPKLVYMCFGQRSDYQCEAINLNPDLLDYSYRNHNTGQDTLDSGQWVRYCSPIPTDDHSPGYVAQGLISNREQANWHSTWGYFAVDSIYNWYVKPRIRIDSSVVDTDPELEVCRIDILNWDSTVMKSVIIRARNFADPGPLNNYSGNYKEEYNFRPTDDNLMINATLAGSFNPYLQDSILPPSPSEGQHRRVLWDMSSKIDFRVYWYGNCKMWIDYVRVENETSKKLHDGDYTKVNGPSPWLIWEAQNIANQYADNIKRFYIEEFEFNQIPAIKYINEYIKTVNPNFSMMVDLNYGTYSSYRHNFNFPPLLVFQKVWLSKSGL
ncbi:MAG TPA: hypothetical protein PKA90_16780, partial [Ignavibacteria bacterium]|nr:hypothetical protein [Ignavibacteria bacterium]HMR42073.1 hypothetical protein [Ignavibacteria bacterium]